MSNIQKYLNTKQTGWYAVMECINKLHSATIYKVTISSDYIYIDNEYQREMFSGNEIGRSEFVRANKLKVLSKMLNEFLENSNLI